MSRRLTFLDIKNSGIDAGLGVCSTSAEFLRWFNLAQERMNNQGRWFGSVQEVQFCITKGCLVLPREVAAIEAAQFDGTEMILGNNWYEYIHPVIPCSNMCSLGFSINAWNPWQTTRCGQYVAEQKGVRCSFDSTSNTNQKLKFYPGDASDAGTKVIVQGKDTNGVWVRTNAGGTVIDGEQVTLAMPFVITKTIWAAGEPTRLIKDVTNYRLLMYQIDATTSAEAFLGEYQPGETRPMYQVLFLPALADCDPNSTCNGCSTIACGTTHTLLATVSLQHIPVTGDNDWALFTNLAAYADAMHAMRLYEQGDFAGGNAYFYGGQAPSRDGRAIRVVNRGGAIPQLVAELRKMTGDRTTIAVRQDKTSLAGFR